MDILAVVVRYKMGLEQSPTVVSLCRTFEKHSKLIESVGLLVWDNSPVPLDKPVLPVSVSHFHYRHGCGENLGVSGAYNRALEVAESMDCRWLLLLDQDTTLTEDYLPRLLECCRLLEDSPEIAAIAPLLMEGEKIISPMTLRSNRWKHARPFSRPFTGVCRNKVFAANSGTLMRVSSLKKVGGYDENFWLDVSDVVVFDRLYQAGKRLYVDGDLRIQHRLTNNDYDGSMSPQRYRNFIAAEGAYWDMYGTVFQGALQTARLSARVIVQYLRYRDKVYSRITGEYLFQRLLSAKGTRLQQWKQQSLKRDLPAVVGGVVVG